MSESRILKPEIIAAFATVIPLLRDELIREFRTGLETLKAAQIYQDPVTTGMWNMTAVPGTNTPPRVPPAEIVYERRKLAAFLSYVEARRNYQLSNCKMKKEDIVQKDGTVVTKLVLDEPENGAQKLAKGRVEQLNTLISEIKEQNLEPLSQFILDFRPNILIDAISDPRFWGEGEGQKHVGVTERVLASLRGQGLLKDDKKNGEK